jgi:hypothetical protein
MSYIWVIQGDRLGPWHIAPGRWRDEPLVTVCGARLPGAKGTITHVGWQWNQADGHAQRNGPFCTDCFIKLVERLA